MVRLGQRLKEERVAKGLTVEQVATATKIRPQFIIAIEQGRYKSLPSKAYAQGFVKNYIAFLGMPLRDAMAMFRREFDEREYVDVLPESFTRQRKIPMHRINWYRTAVSIIVIFLVLLGFLVFQYRAALFPPFVSITQPEENSIIRSEDVTVAGSTESNTTVIVNNLLANVDATGHFIKVIPVFPGRATIVVIVVNKFGKRSVVT